MNLTIENHLTLELVEQRHADELYLVANNNRDHIKKWMPWINHMQSVDFIKGFIAGAIERFNNQSEYAFVITNNQSIIGRIGLYKIDQTNKIGEIGYWIAKDFEGRGIVTKATKTLLDFSFNHLNLNRIEIKCGIANLPSQGIPERLNFQFEGILRQAEFIHGNFQDLKLYSLLKSEFAA